MIIFSKIDFVIAKDFKSCTYYCQRRDINSISKKNPWPLIGKTHYHVQLGLPDKGCSIYWLVVCYVVWLRSMKEMVLGLAQESWVSSLVVIRMVVSVTVFKNSLPINETLSRLFKKWTFKHEEVSLMNFDIGSMINLLCTRKTAIFKCKIYKFSIYFNRFILLRDSWKQHKARPYSKSKVTYITTINTFKPLIARPLSWSPDCAWYWVAPVLVQGIPPTHTINVAHLT